ncbi:MAG: type II toxin-antitoxin system HigB family toxin [Anaerolineales bacterium]|nr:type II toxin-antitoxin system HigB family toxin [Anaerolineales bacterium]
MRLITRQKLIACWTEHPDIEDALKAWEKEAKHAHWKSPTDIKARYRSADFLPGNRVVFNIKGNYYRLIVQIHYNTEVVYIRFVGPHTEYTRINAETI